MAKRIKERNSLIDAIQAINADNPEIDDNRISSEIVDIMTFCDDPRYLDIHGSNLTLYKAQRIILKAFYLGTRGNENMTLTKEEWEWLYAQAEEEVRDGVTYEKNINDVIAKLQKREKGNWIFKELHLVIGRRGSKTLVASIISVYEAYKLIVIGGGNPHKYYQLPFDDDIAIINVALSQNQSGRLFGNIQARLHNSPFFKERIANETTSEIRLFTDMDLAKRKDNPYQKGSILLLCGHSNPDTLAGYNAILLLFDELAFYDDTGKVTGQYFYSRLKPSLAKFYKYNDGRIVQISSPSNQAGVFYDTFVNSKKFDHILSFQLPTWDINDEITYDNEELQADRKRNPEMFAVEFGAQWAKSGTLGKYFPEELIERCIQAGITRGLTQQLAPERGINYYLHVDPASSCDRYVAVMVSKERYINIDGKKRNRVMLVNVWTWEPQSGLGLLFNEIDKQIIEICRKFKPVAVTYDQYNAIHSLQALRANGIHCMQTTYNRSFKERIYRNLREMMAFQPTPELLLYDNPLLIMEMRALKFRPTQRGISFVKDKNGDVKTDDVCDALAGAVAFANEANRVPLAPPVVVQMRF